MPIEISSFAMRYIFVYTFIGLPVNYACCESIVCYQYFSKMQCLCQIHIQIVSFFCVSVFVSVGYITWQYALLCYRATGVT